MEEVHPTRTELLSRKNQISLASQGKDLLSEKRDALLMEFMEVMDEVLESSRRLQKASAAASYALAVAKAVDGSVTLRSTAMATKGEVFVDITGTFIMGVPVPEVEKKSIKKSALKRGYSLTGVTSRVNETASRFEKEIDMVIEIAAVETKLKRLGEEIQKTRRRVNALDYVVVPQLTQQVKYIQATLDERAREELFRLKKVKKSIEAKKKAMLENKASDN
jgi:V/A-type H+-transporting ATPase subunit D